MTNCTRFTVECLHWRSQMQITSKSQLNCMWMSPLQITHANHMWITFKLHVNVCVLWAQGLSCHTHRSRDPAVRRSLAQCNTMSNTMSNAWAIQWALLEQQQQCLWPALTKLAHAGSKGPPVLITTHWPVGHIHYHWPAQLWPLTSHLVGADKLPLCTYCTNPSKKHLEVLNIFLFIDLAGCLS